MEPCRKCRLSAKGSNLTVKLQEGFLGQILSFGRVRGHSKAKRIDAPLVLVIKSLKRLGVSLLSSFNELGFVGIVALSLYSVGQVAFSGRTP